MYNHSGKEHTVHKSKDQKVKDGLSSTNLNSDEDLIEEDLDKEIGESLKTMNYNDRPDGYGFGEAESLDEKRAYEKDKEFTEHCIDMGEGYRPHKGEPYSKDEYGLRNQYGPVDQYTFRDAHLLKRAKDKKKDIETKDKEK
jgi:hypothetical protein